MTDKEIIKYFNLCLKYNDGCKDCGFKGEICDGSLQGKIETLKMVSDLINRQQGKIDYQKAEINLLKDEKAKMSVEIIKQQAEVERLTINMNAFGLGMKREKERADTIRAEAIKEYKEKLKEHAYLDSGITGFQEMVVDLSDIENIADEMVGEQG